jgi:alpha-L-fucosidase
MLATTRREMLVTTARATAVVTCGLGRSCWGQASDMRRVAVARTAEAGSKFAPTWESLAEYQVPEWYRDAKFGIWAHWGPQCAPERGDWYARHMYAEGHPQYKSHLEAYGHPSQFGFKDVIHSWKAEHWDPAALVDRYKRAGAEYFVAMANHHDNLDLWNSRHHAWNSVRVGPQQDLIGGWARAAREQGLPFGVSVHAAHAWRWYESAQGADRQGTFAGVPYDGKLTAAAGAGTWWEGLDPQELYAQNHPLSEKSSDVNSIHNQWNWGNGCIVPDLAYCQKFYDRTIDLIDQHQPELLYFDDTALPLWPISDAGLQIAAYFYNNNVRRHGGRLEAVLTGKILDERQRKCMVWDIERGASNVIEPDVWQTDTCLGGWHYDRELFDRRRYKSAGTVIRMLADIVSKNGNLLLNVPVRSDGTIDEQEQEIVDGIGAWMAIHREAIIGTRPWKVLGEGPALGEAAPLQAQGFNEGRGRQLSAADVRFTVKGDALYAIVLGVPDKDVRLHSLGSKAGLADVVKSVKLLGSDEAVRWDRQADDLTLSAPTAPPSREAIVYKIAIA